MKVDAVMASGERLAIDLEMTPEWDIQGSLGGRPLKLQLQAVSPHTGCGFVYVFSSVEDTHGVLEQVPPCLRDVLFFAPVVGFLKCHGGFQAISYSSWKELISETYFQDFGMPSSMVSSAYEAAEDEDDLSEDEPGGGGGAESVVSDLETLKESDSEEPPSSRLSEAGSDDGSVSDLP
jgi:hypothetical protein